MNSYLIEIANNNEAHLIAVEGQGVNDVLSDVLDGNHGFLVMSARVVSVNGRPFSVGLEGVYAPANLSGILHKL